MPELRKLIFCICIRRPRKWLYGKSWLFIARQWPENRSTSFRTDAFFGKISRGEWVKQSTKFIIKPTFSMKQPGEKIGIRWCLGFFINLRLSSSCLAPPSVLHSVSSPLRNREPLVNDAHTLKSTLIFLFWYSRLNKFRRARPPIFHTQFP